MRFELVFNYKLIRTLRLLTFLTIFTCVMIDTVFFSDKIIDIFK